MKFLKFTASLILAGTASCVVHSPRATMPSLASSPSLRGAGSPSLSPLYRAAIDEFQRQHTEIRLEYEELGSVEGVRLLESGKVNFAISDWPVQRSEAGLQIPTVISAVVPIYNVTGLSRALHFSPEALGGIFGGTIHRWNDARIQNDNPGVLLPGLEIKVVHRSDPAGSTYLLSNYLTRLSTSWRGGAGFNVQWPPRSQGAVGDQTLAESVRDIDGAIGYIAYARALGDNLVFGDVENRSGHFVRASIDTIRMAVQAMPDDPEGMQEQLVFTQGDGYPICGFVWLLAKDDVNDRSNNVLETFLEWTLSYFQTHAAYFGYVPLPDSIAERYRHQMKMLSQSSDQWPKQLH
jgi:phosphate transport system substrate-binding protein